MISNEQETLEFWNKRFKEEGNVGWGSIPQFEWFQKKQDALESVLQPGFHVVDMGCGDFTILKDIIQKNSVSYCGFDGSSEMINHNIENYKIEQVEFINKSFSDLIKEKITCDVLTCFDILFHIVDDKLYKDIVKWIFTQKAKYVLLTYHEIEEKEQSYDSGHFIPRPFKLKQKGYKIIFETSFKDREDLKLVIYEKI